MLVLVPQRQENVDGGNTNFHSSDHRKYLTVERSQNKLSVKLTLTLISVKRRINTYFRCQNNFPLLTQTSSVIQKIAKKTSLNSFCRMTPCDSPIVSSFSALPIGPPGGGVGERPRSTTPATGKIFSRVYPLRNAVGVFEKSAAVRLSHWHCLLGKNCMHPVTIRLTSQ